MWGEKWGQWRLWVILCAPEVLSWHSGKRFVLPESIVSYRLLLSLGWRKFPSWLTLLRFQPLLKCKEPWMSLCSFASLLIPWVCETPAPKYSEICERHWLGEWSPQKAFMKEAKVPQNKGEGTWGFCDRDRDCRASCFFWPAQAVLLSKA